MMKTKSIFAMLIIALTAMTSCSNNDNEAVGPATKAQYEAVTGHWYAEIPISGETDNWRTEEEGDVTTYDKIDALIYLDANTDDVIIATGFWGYIYLQDNDMVNYGGLLSSDDDIFQFSMTSDGYITPSSHLADAPKITNMHYDATANVITATVDYKGKSLSLTFVRPDEEAMNRLNECYEMLREEGIVSAYDDGGNIIHSDVNDDPADEPSRARRR